MRTLVRPLTLAALLSLPLIGVTSVRADDVQSHIQKANAAAAQKDWDKALAELNAVIALAPNNADAHESKSVVLIQKQDFRGAINALDRVIELDPKRVDAYQTRSGLHQRLGENAKAKADYQRVLQLSPEEDAKFLAAAQAATDAKDWQKAYGIWSLWAEAMPSDPRGHYGRGIALFNTVSATNYLTAAGGRKDVLDSYNKTLAEATLYYQAALKADPKFVPAYLALVDKKVGSRSDEEYKNALALLATAIEQVPDSAELYIARARLSEGFVQTPELIASHIADYSHALQLDPNSFAALAGRAWAYRLDKRDDLALIDSNRALALRPDDVKALSNRAQIYEALKDWEHSAADYGRAYALDTTNVSLAFSRYLALMRLPDTTLALATIAELIAKDPKNALYLRSRAETHLARKEYNAALEDVDAALAMEPSNSALSALRTQIVQAQAKK